MIDIKTESCELKDMKGNIIMKIDNNPSINFTLNDVKTVLDVLEPIPKPASAHEAGEALRKVFLSLQASNKEFKEASDVFSELVDAINEIGNINPITPEELAQGLLRAQTPDKTAAPKENEVFNFLEQNAYNEDFCI